MLGVTEVNAKGTTETDTGGGGTEADVGGTKTAARGN